MYILGHSLGGTMAGWYALKRPERVFQTYFVSSAGFSTTFEDPLQVYDVINSFSFVKRNIVKLLVRAWEWKLTLFDLAGKMNYWACPIIKWLINRWYLMELVDRKLLYDYVWLLVASNITTDAIVFNLF